MKNTDTAHRFPILLVLALLAVEANADSWHQFRGPLGDGTSSEKGLLRNWPVEGPAEVWRRPFGDGFSGFAIAEHDFYTLFASGGREYLGRFRIRDAEEVWRLELGGVFQDEFGAGPRSTPTVVNEMVYALGGRGRLVAVRASDGELLWQVDLFKEKYGFFGPQWAAKGATEQGLQLPNWGYAYSPLVEGDLIVVDTGHGDGESIVAFDRWTGEPRWANLDGGIGYASPMAVTIGGQRQILVTAPNEIVSLLPNGEVLWRHPWSLSIAQPLVLPGDRLFLSTVHREEGSMVFRIDTSTGTPEAETLWANRIMKNLWSSSVFYQGVIYGFDNATFRAVSAESGELLWAKRGLGKGSLIAADGQLYIFGDQGLLTLVEATAEGYRQKGQVRIFEGARTWTPPAIAGGKLFLRGDGEIVCLDLGDRRSEPEITLADRRLSPIRSSADVSP